MRTRNTRWLLCVLVCTLPGPVAFGEVPLLTRFTLKNGLRVAIVHAKREKAFAMFTYLPSGLGTDERDHLLWTRVVERLSTQTFGEFDGGTGLDLTWYESWVLSDAWEQGLKAHAQLMYEVPFTEHQAETYREDVLVSTHWGSEDGIAHEEAAAVFAQAIRHRAVHISVKEVLGHATYSDLQAYRDARWRIPSESLLFIVGSIPPDKVKAAVVQHFEGIEPAGQAARPVTLTTESHLEVTWDFRGRYLVMAWPTTGTTPGEKAALIVLRNLLEQKWCKGSDLCSTLGSLRVNENVAFPEGEFFVATLSDRLGTSPDDVRQAIRELIEQAINNPAGVKQIEGLRKTFVEAMLLPDMPLIPRRGPGGGGHVDLFYEWLNSRRVWCNLEWTFGEQREAAGRYLQEATPAKIGAVGSKYLTDDRCITCIVQPQ